MGRRKFPTLYPFKPLTDNQKLYVAQYNEGHNLLVKGYPGTGKTSMAISLGLESVKKGDASSVLILRNNQAVDDLGHRPGSVEDKMAAYSAPYNPIVEHLFNYKTNIEYLAENGYIKFDGIAFLRGTTIDNTVIVVDEIQNMTFQQLDTVITRVGHNSRIIFCGDSGQTDASRSGWEKFTEILNKMPSFRTVDMNSVDDIIRGGTVKEYILAKHSLV